MAGIEFEIDGRGVATLTLNRPESFNSLDTSTTADFVARLDECEADPAIRVVCIRANGKHFCAGADVRKLPGRSGGDNAAPHGPTLPDLLRRLNGLARPTIALAQGGCIGGGAGIIACCDVAVLERSAFVTISEVRLGIPPVALIPYFVAAIGARQTRRYALSGERIEAAHCLDVGFAHSVCDPGQLTAAAAPIVDAMLRGGPDAIAKTKRAIADAAPVALTIEREAVLMAEIGGLLSSAEANEGLSAFLEKRIPGWYRGK